MNEPSRLEPFLLELESWLEGGRRQREQILEEVELHFVEAAEANASEPRAIELAIQRFGSPRTIAEELNSVRRSRLRRRRLRTATASSCAALTVAGGVLGVAATQQGGRGVPTRQAGVDGATTFAATIDPATGAILRITSAP